MRKAVFIGNRTAVWHALRREPDVSLVLTIAPFESYLHRDPELPSAPHRLVQTKSEALAAIESVDFDLLVSNGCPFILPIAQLHRPGRLFTNIHPSLLPQLRGAHPINAALLFEHGSTGATMHYMDDGADTGPIIAQREMPITPDVDVALLYQCLFAWEAEVFVAGMARLRAAEYQLSGDPQTGAATSYTRGEADSQLDLATQRREDVLRRIRAFGTRTQGLLGQLDGRSVRIFSAEPVDNPYVVQRYGGGAPGSVALRYDGKLLVRCIGGLVKITLHAEEPYSR